MKCNMELHKNILIENARMIGTGVSMIEAEFTKIRKQADERNDNG